MKQGYCLKVNARTFEVGTFAGDDGGGRWTALFFYECEPAGDVIFCTGSRMHIDFTLALVVRDFGTF
jgi:hypothetical protein